MTSISDRISSLIKQKGISARALEQRIGCSNGVISRCISKGTDISSQWVSKIIESFDELNAEWLLTGRGNMLKEEPATGNHPVPTAHHAPEGGNIGIPLIPLSAMAGSFTDEASFMEYECERYVVPIFKGADFLIPVKGDSMQPTYFSGDLVACKRVPLDDIFFQWGKTYVLDTRQGPLIKRIKPGADDSHVLVVSDNAAYEPFQLDKSQFHGIALVMGIIRIE